MFNSIFFFFFFVNRRGADLFLIMMINNLIYCQLLLFENTDPLHFQSCNKSIICSRNCIIGNFPDKPVCNFQVFFSLSPTHPSMNTCYSHFYLTFSKAVNLIQSLVFNILFGFTNRRGYSVNQSPLLKLTHLVLFPLSLLNILKTFIKKNQTPILIFSIFKLRIQHFVWSLVILPRWKVVNVFIPILTLVVGQYRGFINSTKINISCVDLLLYFENTIVYVIYFHLITQFLQAPSTGAIFLYTSFFIN